MPMISEAKRTIGRRYILRCTRKSCGILSHVDLTVGLTIRETQNPYTCQIKRTVTEGSEMRLDGTFYQPARCSCGAHVEHIIVRGRVSAHKCGARCTHAKGGDCECECGGKNHGIGHAAS